MKNNEKKAIAILVIVAIIIIVILFSVKNNTNKKNGNNMENLTGESIASNTNIEEYVDVLSDGTKLNTSNKLQETKKFDGMEITDFQLTENGNVSILLGIVTNTSNQTRGGYQINVELVDKEGKEIITIGAYLPELGPGESEQFNTSTTYRCANAYDFKITKK